ncbi:MAG: hypothetical protein A3A86_03285 [Elusimicrobia bacterium RIFCSPLOWO2_01_FULL_60_11]|nr:MAG: hypothetical protein A3A86_03285 [Elusimicrobia bacterium RIFCSPLOWO2_01_FULL_60_11]
MLQGLNDLVPQIIRRLGISEQGFEVITLVEREIQAVSPGSRVAAYKNNKIIVEVESPAHLFELSMRRREILKSLKSIPGLPETELKLFIKGSARPSAADRLRSRLDMPNEKIQNKRK